MTSSPPDASAIDPARCPLCGGPNQCQLCAADAPEGPCWCTTVTIPAGLLARVPEKLRGRACICRACVTAFQLEHPLP